MSTTLFTAIDLLTKLNTLISSRLGNYTYPNGYSGTASCIGSTPRNVKVTGIELILQPLPTMNTAQQTLDHVFSNETWKLHLISRADTLTSDFITLGQDLSRYFWQATMVYLPRLSDIDTYDQILIEFKHLELRPTFR